MREKPINLILRGTCPHCELRIIREDYAHGRTEEYKRWYCKRYTQPISGAMEPCTERESIRGEGG